jgi:menaquinone-specific isochorismate synthase
MLDPAFLAYVSDGLAREPDHLWVRDGLALLGWGETIRFDPGIGSDRYARAQDFVQSQVPGGIPVFSSFTFDEDAGGSVMIVPETLLRIGDDGPGLVSGGPVPEPGPPAVLPRVIEITDDDEQWRKNVREALSAIAANEVQKIVLSRILELKTSGPVPAHRLAEQLVRAQNGSSTFQIDGLLGSSPELLAELKDGKFRSVALAGSVPQSPNALQVLSSSKMIREHDPAADSVEEALAPHRTTVSRSRREVATFGDIAHLATTFSGSLRPGTTLLEVISDLHPTAAVAGTPTQAATRLIREIETHERGRYAGPIGWIDSTGEGEFAIALRCGRLMGHRVILYTGAGLVEGSDADAELEETNLKLRPMLAALSVS